MYAIVDIYTHILVHSLPALTEDSFHTHTHTVKCATNMMRHVPISVGMLKWGRLCIQGKGSSFEDYCKHIVTL
jgi:hypothetical protein